MADLADVLVHVGDESVAGHALELACLLAKKRDARLSAVLVVEPVHSGLGLSPESAALAFQVQDAQHQAWIALGERLVVEVRQQHDLNLDIRLLHGDTVEALHTQTRAADLLITSQADPSALGGLSTAQAARLLMGSACPVLTVPSIGWQDSGSTLPDEGVLNTVLVAWSDTRESARAVRDALPLLRAAGMVEVCSFAGSGSTDLDRLQASLDRLISHLQQHGVVASKSILHASAPSVSERMTPGWVPDVSVAQALLSHAADMGAQLIVMGGYGHSRLREFVLGGVTRSMLQTMSVPVLMSH
jgi:nucleotide-binding universal stress UspA family protein